MTASLPSPRWRSGRDSACLDLRYFSVAGGGKRRAKRWPPVPRLLHLFGPINSKRSRDQNQSPPHPLSVCGPLMLYSPRKLNFFIRVSWCSQSSVQHPETPESRFLEIKKERKKLPIPELPASASPVNPF